MGFNLSTNMNLPVPQVGNEAGPQYAQDVNNCLTLVDQHDHAPGYGVQITPNGININADLPMSSNNLTLTRTVRFVPQNAVLVGVADTGCLYEVINDLYYNDGLGNNIRLTQAGSIAGTSGSISNLVPPASVAYVALSQTVVFQSAANVAANLDAGFIILRTSAVNSPGLTLQVPSSIASDYTITLPVLPASNLPVSINSSGIMSSALITTSQIDATFANRLTNQIIYIKQVEASGVRGGTFTAGSYLTRVLNTLENTPGYAWVSLAANQFTLQAGTYDIQAFAPATTVSQNKARLQNITDNTTAILGSAGWSLGLNVMSGSTIVGAVTVASAKTFEIQHQCAFTDASNGFGEACSFGDSEIYTTVRIEKVYP